MLGIVRLFREQVRQTEKEAQSCWRKVLIQRSRPALSLAAIDQLVEQEAGSEDLLVIWRKNRRALEEIECKDLNASTNISIDKQAFAPFGARFSVPKSSIWRDQDDEVLGWDLDWLQEMEEGGKLEDVSITLADDLISIPRAQIPVSWTSDAPDQDSGSSFGPSTEEVDHARAISDSRRQSLFARRDNSSPHSGEGEHFLDVLIDRSHMEGLEEGIDPMRSVFGASGMDELQEKLEDLLEPVDFDAQGLDQLETSLYATEIDYGREDAAQAREWPDWGDAMAGGPDEGPATGDGEFDVRGDETSLDRVGDSFFRDPAHLLVGEPHLDGSTLESQFVASSDGNGISLQESEANTSRHARRRKQILWDLKGTHIPHETLKANLALKSHTHNESKSVAHPARLRKGASGTGLSGDARIDPMKALLLPQGRHFQFSGALAYIRVAHLASIRNGTQIARSRCFDSLQTISFLPEDSNSLIERVQSDAERNNESLLLFPPAALDTYDRDEYNYEDNLLDYGPRPPLYTGNASGDLVDFESRAASNREEQASHELFGGLAEASQRSRVSSLRAGGEADVSGDLSTLMPRFRASSISESLQGPQFSQSRQSLQGQQSPHGRQAQQVSRISNALLGYITVKAAPPLSNSPQTSSPTSKRRGSTSASAAPAPLTLHGLLGGCKRATAAKTFFHLLELSSAGHVWLTQEAPFADIGIQVLSAQPSI